MMTEQKLSLRNDLHIIRKAWHMASGLTGLSIFYFFSVEAAKMGLGLLVLSAIAFIIEFGRMNWGKLNQLIIRMMGPFMRESERNNISGFPFYALGCALSLLFFSEKIAILAILFLIFSDPISSFFGVLYGKDKIFSNKSLQGAIAGFSTCYLVTMAYLMNYEITGVSIIPFAIMAAIVGMISELMSVIVDDNLTIPLVSGLGITCINFIFNVL